MYESITYEELKSLPRDQKAEALKELKALYPTQKKIAEKLGVNPANIYNMIAKYAKAEDEGQLKAEVKTVRGRARPTKIKAEAEPQTIAGAEPQATAEEESQTITEAEPQATAEAESVTKAETEGEIKAGTETGSWSSTSEPEKTRVRHVREKKMKMEENLMITLSKGLTGEEAQALFAGIGSIFLKNHDYKLEIRISEK